MLVRCGWLLAMASGLSGAMVGVTLAGNNMRRRPGTVGVMLLHARQARCCCSSRWRGDCWRAPLARVIAVLGALGMPLYLWHKLAELPAAWLGERLGLPIDAGMPGEPGFWLGRAGWIVLCLLMVAPVIALVVRFELQRDRDVPAADRLARILLGGAALYIGLAAALVFGGEHPTA